MQLIFPMVVATHYGLDYAIIMIAPFLLLYLVGYFIAAAHRSFNWVLILSIPLHYFCFVCFITDGYESELRVAWSVAAALYIIMAAATWLVSGNPSAWYRKIPRVSSRSTRMATFAIVGGAQFTLIGLIYLFHWAVQAP